MSNFDTQFAVGKVGESEIANWLKARGNHILPIYEIEQGQGKGPQLYTSDGGELIAPDMLCFGNGKTVWIEAKHKNAFSWHRLTKRWTTGIDLHHYEQYIRVSNLVEWPVWLLFLQKPGVAKDTPKDEIPPLPGLYGGDLTKLICNENHRHDNWGKSGMVYWEVDTLTKLAGYPLTTTMTKDESWESFNAG